MKRLTVLLLTSMLISLTACGGVKKAEDSHAAPVSPAQGGIGATVEEPIEETTEEAADTTAGAAENEAADPGSQNKEMLAEALGIDLGEADPLVPDSDAGEKTLRSVMNVLEILEAGQLQSAEAEEDGNDTILMIVDENGVNYKIYITGTSVDAVRNTDTGEWVLKSER